MAHLLSNVLALEDMVFILPRVKALAVVALILKQIQLLQFLQDKRYT
jgi:hypothetical protein